MDNKDTIIIVGATETDQYGNLWVTPQGGGEKVKVAKKRESLHPLFEQGRAVMLHWETYMNKPYVADAKSVEGELKEPVKPPVVEEAMPKEEIKTEKPPAPQAVGMTTKEIGDMIRAKYLITIFGKETSANLISWYRNQIFLNTGVQWKNLPDFNKKEE